MLLIGLDKSPLGFDAHLVSLGFWLTVKLCVEKILGNGIKLLENEPSFLSGFARIEDKSCMIGNMFLSLASMQRIYLV